MADEAPIGGEADGAGGRRPPNPKLIRFLAVIVASIAAIYLYNVFFSSEEKRPAERPTAASDAKGGKDEKKDTKLDVTAPSKEGYVVEMDKRIIDVTNTMNKLVDSIRDFQVKTDANIAAINNKVDKKYGELVERMTAFTHDTQESVRRNASAMGVPLPTVPTSIAPGISGGAPVPGGTVIGPDAQVSPITYVSFGGPAPVAPASRDITDIGKDATDKVDKVLESTDKKLKEAAKVAPAAVAAAKTRKLEVAAGSRVHAVNLHAADCPTGNQNVPIVLPVTSDIRGPNGDVVDLGAPHFIGECVGLENKVDGDKSRARIVVKRLSFVDRRGAVQTIKVEGYIVDRRDSAQDIEGQYESKQGEALAKSAAAAGLAAIGQITTSAEFTNITGAGSGTATSSLTGSAGKAALGQAVGAAADKVSQYYSAQVTARVPIVHINANIPMTVMLTSPFIIELPVENNQHAALY